MLRVSPIDSESDGWFLDTLEGTDADFEVWHSSELSPPSSPLEYHTLFDNKGFIFNTRRSGCKSSGMLQVPTRTRNHSFSKNHVSSDPASPTDQLTAVLRTPITLCPSLALLRCIEMDPGAAERELAVPRGRFLRTATTLHTRLLDLDSDNSGMLYEGFLLRHGFQELLASTDLLVLQARRLQQDIQDILYFNDLLWMLRGRLEKVTPRRWPFLSAHNDEFGEINLIV